MNINVTWAYAFLVCEMNCKDSLQPLATFLKHCWSSTSVRLNFFSLLSLTFWIIVQAHNFYSHLFTYLL